MCDRNSSPTVHFLKGQYRLLDLLGVRCEGRKFVDASDVMEQSYSGQFLFPFREWIRAARNRGRWISIMLLKSGHFGSEGKEDVFM